MTYSLELDIRLALAGELAWGGLTEQDLVWSEELVREAQEALVERRTGGDLAWMELPQSDPVAVLEFADRRRRQYGNLLVLGIGGSALGTTALAGALLHPYYNLLSEEARGARPRLFVLDNVDPDQTRALFDFLDWDRTLVNVVSKSGGTAETAATYLMARGLLEERFASAPDPDEAVRSHLVFTTDPCQGVLREIAREEGIAAFAIPPGVGGRFSVLSAVGLLPAAMCGIDVRELLAGARAMDERISSEPGLANPAGLFAAVQFLEYTRYGRHISVLMPYSARLRDLADWYRQLWAESLGKARDRDGRRVEVGPTPISALGVTDQHSQVQLYIEGPDDKITTFIRVGAFDRPAIVPALHAEKPALAYLGGHDLGELMNAEQQATAWALAQKGRPSVRIDLPRVNAECLGQLMFMFEYAVALMGELLNVNAFDQPGVELGKEATYALLSRPGYEQPGAPVGAPAAGERAPTDAAWAEVRPVLKVWLDREGKAFGGGPLELLRGVERTGSLRQAALSMHMSYNKAWHLIRALEKKLGLQLLERNVGGTGGGGSELTPAALDLIGRFAAFEQGANEAVEALFRKYFSGPPGTGDTGRQGRSV